MPTNLLAKHFDVFKLFASNTYIVVIWFWRSQVLISTPTWGGKKIPQDDLRQERKNQDFKDFFAVNYSFIFLLNY